MSDVINRYRTFIVSYIKISLHWRRWIHVKVQPTKFCPDAVCKHSVHIILFYRNEIFWSRTSFASMQRTTRFCSIVPMFVLSCCNSDDSAVNIHSCISYSVITFKVFSPYWSIQCLLIINYVCYVLALSKKNIFIWLNSRSWLFTRCRAIHQTLSKASFNIVCSKQHQIWNKVHLKM